jgi:hypothetical protein
MNLKYIIFIYLIFILLIFLIKPQILNLNVQNKKRKILYLTSLIIIIAIISFYIKILVEYFF